MVTTYKSVIYSGRNKKFSRDHRNLDQKNYLTFFLTKITIWNFQSKFLVKSVNIQRNIKIE